MPLQSAIGVEGQRFKLKEGALVVCCIEAASTCKIDTVDDSMTTVATASMPDLLGATQLAANMQAEKEFVTVSFKFCDPELPMLHERLKGVSMVSAAAAACSCLLCTNCNYGLTGPKSDVHHPHM